MKLRSSNVWSAAPVIECVQSGKRRWFTDAEQNYGWTPAVDDHRVYAAVNTDASAIHVFDRETGAASDMPDGHALQPRGVLGENNDLFAVTREGVVAFDRTTDAVNWQ